MKRLDTLEDMRDEASKYIRSVLEDNSIEVLYSDDIWDGNPPIILEDVYNSDNTFTLDKIIILNGCLAFQGSSVYNTFTWDDDEIPTDALMEIADWLEDNTDEIKEFIKNE